MWTFLHASKLGDTAVVWTSRHWEAKSVNANERENHAASSTLAHRFLSHKPAGQFKDVKSLNIYLCLYTRPMEGLACVGDGTRCCQTDAGN